jgi:hypothetical protein
LNEEITRQTVWAFNQDEAHTVSCDALKQSLEAFTLPVVNGSAYAFITKLAHDLNTVPFGVGLDRFPLTRESVSADLTHRGNP